ncbi:MAG: M42 family metallopeptidase [Clostridia bacterium]|nr:M42 family metallopeptidase [Clostridia bacterium]
MDLLKKLTEFDAPSGKERVLHTFLKEEAEKLGYEVTTDALGSVIAHKKGNGKKLMVAAHTDEIGVIANYIDDNGFIRFGAIGGLYKKELHKRRVRFENGTVGIIGAQETAFDDKPDINKLFIDIGAKNKEEAKKLVKTGDTAVFDGAFALSGDTVISKALDDRVGCYILLKAMAEIKESKNDLYFVFTAQEEVGIRGAKTSAYTIMPHYGIAVDVTDTGDTPDAPKSDVKLGGGAAIKVMDRSVLCDAEVIKTLRTLADENSISYTNEIMTDGGTDAGAIALTGGGVKAGGISVPVRYIHSPSELASVSDINACIKLLTIACRYEW